MLVDIFVILVLLVSVVIAILRGFIREVLTIFGLAGGAAAAYMFAPLLTPSMRGWLGVTDEAEPAKLMDIVPYTVVADVLSYAVIFIVFVIILSVLSHFLAEFVKNMGLGAIDRSLGAVFGLVRGALVLGLLYLPILHFVEEDQMKEDLPFLHESQTRIYLAATSQWINGFLPNDLEENEDAEDGIKQLSEAQKKLQDMNLLDNDDVKNKIVEDVNKKKDGYTDEARDAMDKLIEKSNDPKPSYNE